MCSRSKLLTISESTNMMMTMLLEITKTVKQLQTGSGVRDTVSQLPHFSSLEEISNFNPDEEGKKLMVTRILRIGGSRLTLAVSAAVRKLISAETQTRLSMKGQRSGKFPFASSTLYKMIKEAIMMRFTCTEKEVWDTVGSVLKDVPKKLKAVSLDSQEDG